MLPTILCASSNDELGLSPNCGCSKLSGLETAILRGKNTFANLSQFHRRALFIAKVRKSQLSSTSVAREMRFMK